MASEEVMESPGPVLREAGARILAAADDAELKPEGAVWLFEEEPRRWRYYLVTSLLEEKGPMWIYRKLLQVFSVFEFPPGIDKLDLRLCSPREPAMKALTDFMKGEIRDVGIRGITINNIPFSSVLIERLNPPRPREEARRVARRFERRVEELLAA